MQSLIVHDIFLIYSFVEICFHFDIKGFFVMIVKEAKLY